MQEEELRDLTLSVLTSLTVGVTGYLLHWSAELALQQDPDQGYEQGFLSVPLLFHKHLAFTLVRRIWTFTLVRRICMGYIGLLSGRRVTGIRTEEEDACTTNQATVRSETRWREHWLEEFARNYVSGRWLS